jgi:hypothetical protein
MSVVSRPTHTTRAYIYAHIRFIHTHHKSNRADSGGGLGVSNGYER